MFQRREEQEVLEVGEATDAKRGGVAQKSAVHNMCPSFHSSQKEVDNNRDAA